MSRPFVHLHVHSDYSLLDGACTIPKLVRKASGLNMPALAVTDHGNLFGAVQFYSEAKKAGVKPVIGVELYVAQGSRFEKSSTEEKRHHLVLLVRNQVGYRNLCKLVSLSYTEGFYYRPRVDRALLAEHAEGLVCMTSCLQGEIPSLLGMDEDARAESLALHDQELFGKGSYYLEIQDHGIPEQKKINYKIKALSKKTGIPMVATNDCHYIEADDYTAHEVLVCIQTNKQLSDEKRMQFHSREFYFKSGEQMMELFGDVPEALDNTLVIAGTCDFDFDLHAQHYPRFEVSTGETLDTYFERTAREGFRLRASKMWGPPASGERRYPPAEYESRLEYEIRVINKLNYAAYFLIVWDFIREARSHGIPVGPGRGSAAGSLVAYSLGITDIDPLQYDLLFERFLNPERVSPPDIDIDFCYRRREEVIRYVTEKYGKDCVCQIITFGTMRARAVLRDVGRVLGIAYGEVDRIAKLVPSELEITLDKALEKEPRIAEAMKESPKIRELVDISRRLEGFSRHSSVHAAGVVIAPFPLVDMIPLSMGTDGVVTTQYTMKDVERLGLLKMDFLGLITLTVVQDALAFIKRYHGVTLDIDTIPLDDAATYNVFAEGRTAGIFQFESSGMRGYLRRLRPNRFEDLIAMNALYRPGPLQGGMIDDFVRRKQGQSDIGFFLPELEPILKATYGVIVYQEQVMQIASNLAGFTMGEADTLRKAMGKKQADMMAKMGAKFVEGCASKGISKERAKELFDLMEKFAAYGFNKSHSAAYAWVAYQTAYLKAHYPAEFMSAVLTSEKGSTGKVVQYISECKNMGIPILPPSINESELDFKPSPAGIRFGLCAIKNVGESAIQGILAAREKGGAFKSFTDFCCRVDSHFLNSRVMESLIKSGVFDELKYTRAQLVEVMGKVVDCAQKTRRDRAFGQKSLFDLMDADEGPGGDDENFPPVPEWDKKTILSHEKGLLGFYISGHPLDDYAEAIKTCSDVSLDQLTAETPSRNCRVACVFTEITQKKTSKGEAMCVGHLEDLTGSMQFVAFSKTCREFEALLAPDIPVLVTALFDVEERDNQRVEKMVVNEIHLLSEAGKRRVSQIALNLDLDRLDPMQAREMVQLLLANRGDCTVEIVMRKRGIGVAHLPANGLLQVKWTPELEGRIENLTYPGAVSYEC